MFKDTGEVVALDRYALRKKMTEIHSDEYKHSPIKFDEIQDNGLSVFILLSERVPLGW